MIELAVDEASVDRTVEWLEAVRLKIFAGIREAMTESVQDLAIITVADMNAAGIERRTGDLERDILKSPGTWENATTIACRVLPKSNMTIKGRTFFGFLGTALDEGYMIPAQPDLVWSDYKGEGQMDYRYGHSAIKIAPHPFLREAQQTWMPSFIEMVEARISEVVAEANR